MIKINLFPTKEIKRKKTIINIVVFNIILFLILTSISIFLYFENKNNIEMINKSIKNERKKLIKLASLRRKIEEFKKKKKILKTKLRIINNLDSNRLFPSYLFYILSNNVPDQLWLTYLKMYKNNITVKGIALDEQTVVKFIKNLKNTNIFKAINLIQVNQRIINNLKLKEFYITIEPNYNKLKGII